MKVISRTNQATFWTLLADETTDRQKREQMVMVCMYVQQVDSGKYVVREDPFALIDVFDSLEEEIRDHEGEDSDDGDLVENKLSGKAIAKVNNCDLNLGSCIGQGYDGAASLSSQAVGAAAEVKKAAPLAEYYHCVSHASSLSASKVLVVPVVRNAHDAVSHTVNFLSGSATKRTRLFQTCATKAGCEATTLITLFPTRFVERHSAVVRFWACLPAVFSTLELISTWDDCVASGKAHSLMTTLQNSSTLVGLVCLKTLSAHMKPLSQACSSVAVM